LISHDVLIESQCKIKTPSALAHTDNLLLGSERKLLAVFKAVPDALERFINAQKRMSRHGLEIEDDPRCRTEHSGYTICYFHAHSKSGESCPSKKNHSYYVGQLLQGSKA